MRNFGFATLTHSAIRLDFNRFIPRVHEQLHFLLLVSEQRYIIHRGEFENRQINFTGHSLPASLYNQLLKGLLGLGLDLVV